MRSTFTLLLMLLMTAPAAADDGVTVLFSFEPDDAKKLGAEVGEDANEATWQPVQTTKLALHKGDATHGQWALVADRGKYTTGKAPHYNIQRRAWVFNGYPDLSRLMSTDWSGNDRLRIDLRSVDADAVVRVEIEDVLCEPTVRGVYELPAGKWVTCEMSLADAARVIELKQPDGTAFRGRRLNLAKMANLMIYPEQVAKPTTLMVDNIRLLTPEAKDPGKLEVRKSIRPMLQPQPLEAGKPTPRKLDVRGNPPAGEPALIDASLLPRTGYPRVGGITGRALAVADADRILLGFLGGYVHVLQSADGGKNWHGLDGGEKPTRIYHDANAPSHVAAAAGPDLLYAYSDHCAGGGNPSNMFFRQVRWDAEAKGWSLDDPHLLDVDCRHCPEWRVELLRLGSGRLWAAWMHLDRGGKLIARARFSDDGGKLWRDPGSNAMVTVDRDNSQGPQTVGVTLWPESGEVDLARANGRIGEFYSQGGLAMTPVGDTVGLMWVRSWKDDLWWTIFEKGNWSEPKQIGAGKPGSIVTFGPDTVYVTVSRRGKSQILRLADGKWTDDTPADEAGGVLTISGDTLYRFSTSADGETFKLFEAHKPAAQAGGWSQPRLLATEQVQESRPSLGVTAPRVAPEGFIPLAWGPPHGWIKFLRLPTK